MDIVNYNIIFYDLFNIKGRKNDIFTVFFNDLDKHHK